ncbi:6-phosphofructokinase [Dokdonella sp.]|uniref:6-phosphofructokinase n=1 Tax=Dokdonella sp. TaxID=2291710 RepID=UPI0031C0E497|nr:6-phosphofructokinase [Dokdonella sp.]
MQDKLLYAQSGGVTAVINATAAAVITAARAARTPLLAARNGILGVLREDLVDTRRASTAAVTALRHTPGGAFGTCRYKLGALEDDRAEYARLLAVCQAHGITCLLYNGGNDSADTALKLSGAGRALGYPLRVIAVPKTVDNDLAATDTCPGFGSAAKYVALSVLEAGLDVESMHETSTRVFILEVMGRHAGWLAAAGGLAARSADDSPHLILFPEIRFDPATFLARVRSVVARRGYCTVVASEGLRDADGNFLAEAGGQDAFGHVQLGGVAPRLAGLVQRELGLKCHWAVPDYLQRSARHIASATDARQAWAVGEAAVALALEGHDAVMPVIVRESDAPYRWRVEAAPLTRIANRERKLPRRFISRDGYAITAAARRHLQPLIQGEDTPPWTGDGLPRYPRLQLADVPRRLPEYLVEGA